MAITGRFLADFSDFQAAVQKADIALKGMETGANAVSKSLDKMTDAFSGRKIVQEATLMAQAFEQLASKGIALTNKELQKMGAVADEAIAKLKAGGQAIPPGIQKISDAAAKAAASLKAMGSGFSGEKLIADANATVKAVADLGGAAKLTEKEMQQVNATVTEAIAKYKALGQAAPQAMTDLAKATSTAAAPTSLLGKTMGDLGTQLKATALGFISAQAIIGGVSAAFNALTGFISSSIDAFANAEAASKKVEAALHSQGQATPELVAQYEALATTFEKTTGFADDLIQEMQALFITVGDVGPAQMDDALQAATDLAAGLGIDLRTATLAVAKAFEGNTGALKKYGVVVDEAALATEGMSAVLDEINTKFGGQAAARMETYAGKVAALANAWDNLKEKVGESVATNEVVIAAIRLMTEALDKQNKAATTSGAGAKSWAESWNTAVMSTFPIIGQWIALQERAKAANALSKQAADEAALIASMWKKIDADLASDLAMGVSKADREAAVNAAFAESLKKVSDAVDTLSAAQKKLIAQGKEKGFNPEEIATGLKISQKAVEAYTKALTESEAAGKKSSQAQREAMALLAEVTVAEYATMVETIQDYEKKVTKASRTTTLKVEEIGEAYKNMAKDHKEVIRVLGVIKAPEIELPHIPHIDFEAIYKGLDRVEDNTKKANASAQQFTKSLTAMAQALTNLGKVSGGFGKIAQDLATLVNAIATGRTAVESMKQGLADLGTKGKTGDALLQIGTSALTMASAFMQATETGSAMQKTLKGAALGASIGKQWGLIGAAIGAAAGALAGFIRSLNAARNAVKDFAKSFGGFTELRRQLTILGDEGERLWKKLTQGSGTPEQAAASAKEITKALEQVPKKLNEMVAAAAKAGSGLDAAMVPYIEDLIRAGQLTEENANLLLGLPAAGVPSFNEVSAAAEALGLNIDTIGESIKQLKFTDTAETLAKNLDILSRAGADMDAVLNGVKDQLQALVTDALKFGRTLPESLRPFLQQLIGSGKLTDEFGNQLMDLGALDFAKPLEDSIDDLIVAMHELVDVIRNDVGAAIDDIGRKVVRPKIAPEYLPASGSAAPAPLPSLAEGEAAIREAPMEPPPAELTVIMEIDGRTAASAVVPYMPGEAKRFVAT